MSQEGEGKVTLLDCWVSPFCMRVKIALAEKGVNYETREENLFGGKSQLLLNSNPIYQKVPVLIHNGRPLCESTVIVGYIEDTWTSPPLLPSDAYGRAQARFWVDYVDKKLFDAARSVWMTKGEAQEAAKKELIEVMEALEEVLGDKEYFGGDSFGYVDIEIIPFTSWFLASEKFGNFKLEGYCPKITAWTKRCLQRESVAKVVPDPEKVCEFVMMMRKMQGMK
ncbi:hypothetical protein K2173_003766 [Erythroxylum novogranatense]|uniref:glutathione transferase n=1 Tax=Erythroxylum novogranatense TaxID=1862640 RepID=A0AAV8SIW5_9ROSI|nr:hypothetical protein K2173_003766 [Erythroxylum novogranatense]